MKCEGDTHVQRCVGLHMRKLQRYCHSMLYFEAGDGFDVLVQVHVANAEIYVNMARAAAAHSPLCPAFHALI